MKSTIYIFLLLMPFLNYSQVDKTFEYQKLAFIEAERYLKNNQLEMAIEFFNHVNKLDMKSELAKIAIQRSDSILNVKIKNKIIGKWILFESGSNWGFISEENLSKRKILIISEDDFQFYEKDITTQEYKLIKIEKSFFTKKKDVSGRTTDFVFKDKSLWMFYFDEKRNILRQIYTGEETDEGRTEMVCGNTELNYKRYED